MSLTALRPCRRLYLAGALVVALLAGCGRPTNNAATTTNWFGSGMSSKGAEYVKQLKSRSPTDRRRAIVALSNLQDPYTVPALIEALDDEVDWNRYNAAGALVRITNQNFHSDEKPKWQKWWHEKGDEFIDNYADIRKGAIESEGSKIYATQGFEYYGQGNFVEAIKKFQIACARTPSNWEYHNMLGQSYLALGYVLDARLEFELALGIDQEAMAPRLNLARSFVEVPNPDWEMGQDILEKALDLETQILAAKKEEDRRRDWQLRYVMGWIMLNRGDNTRDDFRRSIKMFREALEIQEKLRVLPWPDVINQLVIASHRAGLEYEAWKGILQLRTLGYDVQESLYNEVRAALTAQDPDLVVPPYSLEDRPVIEVNAAQSLPRPPELFKPQERQ